MYFLVKQIFIDIQHGLIIEMIALLTFQAVGEEEIPFKL